MSSEFRQGKGHTSKAKKIGRGRLLVLVGFTLGGCASTSSAGPESASVLALRSEIAQPLQPGDAIRLSFSRDLALNGEYAIDETGSAVLPLLGSRLVTDRPAPEVKLQLAREYEDQTRNQSVQVVYLRRVRVLGEVRNPGLYHVDPTMTLDDALALAGGTSSDGDLRNVSLVRSGELLAEGLDASLSLAATVQSGDQIYVPKTSWLSRHGAVVIGATISALGVIIAWGR